MIVLQNARLIKDLTEGFDQEHADIVIDGDTIKDICLPGGSYPNAECIDIKGMTVLPGLFDLHCHLMFADLDFYALMMCDANETLLHCMEFAGDYLKHGYTTVRDCGCSHYSNIAVRNAIERGIVAGPDVITCGSILTPTAKGNETFNLYDEIDDPSEIMQACRRDVAHGADFIKYMATGSVANSGGDPGELIATSEELDEIVRAADFLGTYVAAHCHGIEGIKQCVRSGIRTIEHATYIDDEAIEMIIQQNHKIALIPTFACMYDRYIGFDLERDKNNEISVQCYNAFIAAKTGLRKAYDAGISMGWGTDIDRPTFLDRPGLEFTARKKMGLTNIQLIKQATIDSAKAIGIDHKTGSIKVGKDASLAIFDGNPDENIELFNDLPAYVLKKGHCIHNISERG